MVIIVQAPASTANLGPGFDVAGFAVARYVWVTDSADAPLPDGAAQWDKCGPEHIARIAYEKAGGTGDIWFCFELEPGRGLGFSAAARAAGAVLARLTQGDSAPDAQRLAYPVVAGIEGHGDNAAPAVFGGLHVIAGDLAHRIDGQLPGNYLAWVPTKLSTPTDESRLQLPNQVDRAEAVFNLGRFGLLMAAVYENRPDLLALATQDQLHQPFRLEQCGPARRAITIALEAGASAAWLSGSGPTVFVVAPPSMVEAVVEALPADGQVLRLLPDNTGAVAV